MPPINSGGYVGSWEIHTPGGFRLAGYRHTCIGMVDRLGNVTVAELVGPPDHWRSEIVSGGRPYYSSWGGYRWVQIAPVTSILLMQEGIQIARMRFSHTFYRLADSNRFVGMALHHARIRLTAQALVPIGAAPALNDIPGL